MATIDTVTLGINYRRKGYFKEKHVNVSDIVGIGERNERNDVMLIQALFKIFGYNDLQAKEHFNLAAEDLPEPTGDFDEKTRVAIWEFQIRMSYRLLNADGKIHP